MFGGVSGVVFLVEDERHQTAEAEDEWEQGGYG